MTRDPAARVREAGLRVTRPRLAVLETLEELGGHRSADELAAALRARGRPLPRSSIYNVLDDLSARGLVMRAELGPGRERFEAGTAWHHHLVCRVCGSIVDVPCGAQTRPCLEPELTGARIERAEVVYRGLCPACV